DVDGGAGAAVRGGAGAEGLAAAGGAEAVPDRVAVEAVVGHCLVAGFEFKRVGRHEPEQQPLAAAMRAVAFDRAIDLAVDPETHGAAVATADVHGIAPMWKATVSRPAASRNAATRPHNRSRGRRRGHARG